MINLEIEGKEFQLASDWSEITFGQYIDIINVNKDNSLNDLAKAVRIVAHISNKPEECESSLLELSKDDFESLAKEFEWTNKEITAIASEKETLEIDGKTYKIKKDYNRLTLGEMISVEELISHNKNLDAFEVAFGVLLREVDENGNEKGFDGDVFNFVVTKLQSKVMLLDVYNYITFFLRGVQKSTTKTTKGYSIRVTEKNL